MPATTLPCISGIAPEVEYSQRPHLQRFHPMGHVVPDWRVTRNQNALDGCARFSSRPVSRLSAITLRPSAIRTSQRCDPKRGAQIQLITSKSAVMLGKRDPSVASSAWRTACLVRRGCLSRFHFLKRHIGPANAQVHEAVLAHGLGVEQVAPIDHDGIA